MKVKYKKKCVLYLLGILLIFGLTACAGKNKAQSDDDTEQKSEETLIGNNDNSEPSDTEAPDTEAEATKEPEIHDCIPEGPADIDFNLDNMGFYMEGETFTLPMPYSEFLAKAESLGYSVNEDSIRLYSAESTGYAKGRITFERAVENQENPEGFEIGVINSADPGKDIDLTDPDIHVVTFWMHMFASIHREEIDGESVRIIHTFNFDSQLYLTKEIGMGRNAYNARAVWGESVNDSLYFQLYTTGDSEPPEPLYPEYSPDPFIQLTCENSRNDYETYSALAERYGGDFDLVITTIYLGNNPYIQ